MDERTMRIMLNNAAIHGTVQRAFITVMLSGLPVTEETVWQVAEPLLANATPRFRSDIRANIQDILTNAEMLRGGKL